MRLRAIEAEYTTRKNSKQSGNTSARCLPPYQNSCPVLQDPVDPPSYALVRKLRPPSTCETFGVFPPREVAIFPINRQIWGNIQLPRQGHSGKRTFLLRGTVRLLACLTSSIKERARSEENAGPYPTDFLTLESYKFGESPSFFPHLVSSRPCWT